MKCAGLTNGSFPEPGRFRDHQAAEKLNEVSVVVGHLVDRQPDAYPLGLRMWSQLTARELEEPDQTRSTSGSR